MRACSAGPASGGHRQLGRGQPGRRHQRHRHPARPRSHLERRRHRRRARRHPSRPSNPAPWLPGPAARARPAGSSHTRLDAAHEPAPAVDEL